MRAVLLIVAAIASTTIGFAQAPSVARCCRGSASVRPPAWRQLRTAVGSLLGWQVGVPLGELPAGHVFRGGRQGRCAGRGGRRGRQRAEGQRSDSKESRLQAGAGRNGCRPRQDDDAERADAGVCHACDQRGRARSRERRSSSRRAWAWRRWRSSERLRRCRRSRSWRMSSASMSRSSGSAKDCARRASRPRPANRCVCRSRQVDAGGDGAARWNCAAQRQGAGAQAERSKRRSRRSWLKSPGGS